MVSTDVGGGGEAESRGVAPRQLDPRGYSWYSPAQLPTRTIRSHRRSPSDYHIKKIVNTVLLLLRKNDSTATGAPFLTAAVLANASPGSPSDVDLVKSVKPLIIQVTGAQQPFLKCHSR